MSFCDPQNGIPASDSYFDPNTTITENATRLFFLPAALVTPRNLSLAWAPVLALGSGLAWYALFRALRRCGR